MCPDANLPFIVGVEASDTVLGAVLAQKHSATMLLYLQHVFQLHGIPRHLALDCGIQFTLQSFLSLCDYYEKPGFAINWLLDDSTIHHHLRSYQVNRAVSLHPAKLCLQVCTYICFPLSTHFTSTHLLLNLVRQTASCQLRPLNLDDSAGVLCQIMPPPTIMAFSKKLKN